MKRIILLLTVALVMTAMMVLTAAPAFAFHGPGSHEAIGKAVACAASSGAPPFCPEFP